MTIFEILLTLIANSGSANSIIHYLESKKWFEIYKEKTEDHYYKIPYDDWRGTTLINLQHIEIMSKLIHNGSIRVIEEPQYKRYIVISPNKNEVFQSRTPSDYIHHICRKEKEAFYLMRYLDEFYSYEFRRYKYEYSNQKYLIDYDDWMDYICVNYTEIEKLTNSIIKGKFTVHYDKEKCPSHVEISI
jgi:hypothetical protein